MTFVVVFNVIDIFNLGVGCIGAVVQYHEGQIIALWEKSMSHPDEPDQGNCNLHSATKLGVV